MLWTSWYSCGKLLKNIVTNTGTGMLCVRRRQKLSVCTGRDCLRDGYGSDVACVTCRNMESGSALRHRLCQLLCVLTLYAMGVQEDDDEASTVLVPIVLAGSQCSGTEPGLPACPEFELGKVGSQCGHNADVHLVCYNTPNPGDLPLPHHACTVTLCCWWLPVSRRCVTLREPDGRGAQSARLPTG